MPAQLLPSTAVIGRGCGGGGGGEDLLQPWREENGVAMGGGP